MSAVTFLQDPQTGHTIFSVGDEVEDDVVRFFIGSINDSQSLCFIDKKKPWIVKNEKHPMAACAAQGNYGATASRLTAAQPAQPAVAQPDHLRDATKMMQPAKPLTDEQIDNLVREAAKGSAIRRDGSTSHRIARAIEAAHGIKETS